jgi:flagellar biogenesis protein FliO
MRDMLESALGETGAVVAQYIITLLVILVVVVVAIWVVRRFGSGAITGGSRVRPPRLAIVDDLSIDRRRRLILVRRDNVEHLLLIGGPTDVVVDPFARVRSTAQVCAADFDSPLMQIWRPVATDGEHRRVPAASLTGQSRLRSHTRKRSTPARKPGLISTLARGASSSIGLRPPEGTRPA